MPVGNLPILILCINCLIAYGVVAPRLFKMATPVKIIRSKHLLFYLFVGMGARVIWHTIFYSSPAMPQLAGVVLGCCSLALFVWAYRQHGNQMPGRAFTPDVPAVLITTGPYSRLRHPVCTAYILSYLGMLVGTLDGVLALAWLLLVGLYFKAATLEERLLGNSFHAATYRLYQQQSGLLLPWNFWRPRKI